MEIIARLNEDGSITREWLIGSPDAGAVRAILITRNKLYPCVARPGPAWRWVYTYTPDNGVPREYGTGITELRGFLKRTFPHASIATDWQPR